MIDTFIPPEFNLMGTVEILVFLAVNFKWILEDHMADGHIAED